MIAGKQIHPANVGDEYDGKGNTYRVVEHKEGDSLHVAIELVYPSYDNRKSLLTVGLEATRAVDSFRMWFSMQRNCWVVEMLPTRHDGSCMNVVGDWREVTTIPAWLDGLPGEQCPHPRKYHHADMDICEVCGETWRLVTSSGDSKSR